MNNDLRQGTAWQRTGNLDVSSAQSAPQGTGGRGLSRGQKIALGAVVGAGVGLVVGEYWFGRGLDLPHGPDMLLGAGIGAAVGALIARVVAENKTSAPITKGPVSVVPVLSPSHKSVFVMVVL